MERKKRIYCALWGFSPWGIDGLLDMVVYCPDMTLSERLHAQGKLLTAAVLRGATADGNIYI